VFTQINLKDIMVFPNINTLGGFMFGILVLMFTLIPALEIYLLFKLGSFFGFFNTILIIITTGIVGAALAKSQGLAILNKIQTDLSTNKIPTNEIISGFLVFGGGLLLLTPGFLTDILGFSMIFPVTRLLYIEIAKKMFAKGIASGNIKFYSAGSGNPFSKPSSNHTRAFDDAIEADFERK
jgi:UPF0716 protein FxsA